MIKGTPLATVVLAAAVLVSGCSSTAGTKQAPVVEATAAKAVAAPEKGEMEAADICENLSFPSQAASAPPAIKPPSESVRVLAFGDFGDGGPGQEEVAKAMATYHGKPGQRFDFGITLGDNFYDMGLRTATDPRWATNWEDRYGKLGIRLYASLGNHDYYDPASPIAEALYSQHSKSWCLPASYYTYTAGPVQFFVLDTDWIMREWKKDTPADKQKDPVKLQREWLEAKLKASKSIWKVVYGHHPAYSTGGHEDNRPIIDQILPVLKGQADVYIAGHDHDMQYLKPEGGVHFFISGAGGHDLRDLKGKRDLRIWGKQKTPGFSVLDANAGSLTVKFLNTKNAQLCSVKLIKGKAEEVDCPNTD